MVLSVPHGTFTVFVVVIVQVPLVAETATVCGPADVNVTVGLRWVTFLSIHAPVHVYAQPFDAGVIAESSWIV